jgi:pimeloyl-ACP methyl ester carboxylesterase
VLHAHGVDLAHWERGSGFPLLFLHETATGADVWHPLADALGEGTWAISYDRRGWGGSATPQSYARTTIEEQSADAAALLEALGVERALLCGSGLGAVAALDLLLRRPDLVSAAVLIEPPLLAFVPEATAGLSADRLAIVEAIRGGGPEAAMDLYLAGGLPFLGAGAERIPPEASRAASERPRSLFAELGAVPSWLLRPAELRAVQAPSRIVVSAATPTPLRVSAEHLAGRLRGSELVELAGDGLPHVTAATALADLIAGLTGGDGRISSK